MKIYSEKNNLSFGSILMNVRFNNEIKITDGFKNCENLKNELLKEKDKIIFKAEGFIHPRKSNFAEYDFFIRCVNKDGSTNYNNESKLKKRFNDWAENNGYSFTVKESILMNSPTPK